MRLGVAERKRHGVDSGQRAIALDTPGALIASLGAPKVVTHEGTLEDVFVALTGRHLRDE